MLRSLAYSQGGLQGNSVVLGNYTTEQLEANRTMEAWGCLVRLLSEELSEELSKELSKTLSKANLSDAERGVTQEA